MIRFDANATVGVLPAVAEAVAALAPGLGNPSSVHRGGQAARSVLEEARDAVSRACGAAPGDTVVFTSSATEANNWALGGDVRGTAVAAASHVSVLAAAARSASRHGGRTVVVGGPPGEAPDRFVAALRPLFGGAGPSAGRGTVVVSLPSADNETGSIFPVARVAYEVKARFPDVLVHVDAVQSFGKEPFDFAASGADTASLSGHKIGAYPGTGALVIRRGVSPEPLLVGGPQESFLRAGTENVYGAAAFAEAARLVSRRGPGAAARLAGLRDTFVRAVTALPSVSDLFHGRLRLPNTASLAVSGVRADDLVIALDLEGVEVSSGSACASGKPGPSHVLAAYGVPPEVAAGVVRVSLWHDATEEDVRSAASSFARCVARMRRPDGDGAAPERPAAPAGGRP